MTTENIEQDVNPVEEEPTATDVPATEDEGEEMSMASFAELLDEYEYTVPQKGQIIRGRVIRVEDDAIFMDVGAKRDAIVPHTDLERLEEEMINRLERGVELPVYVLKTPVGDEELLVSINKGLEQEDWERAEHLMEEDETVELDIVGYNKGGLLVQFGQLQGFVPNSHVPDLRYGGGQTQIESRKARKVSESLLLKVLEVDQPRRRLIFSAKAAHKEQRRRRLQDLEAGTVLEGRVANLVKYGAFVNLGGGVSGLLHVSEMAWHRVDHPSEVLKVGDIIDVQVQEVDVERERVSLSRKAVLPNPWDTIEERYNIGDLTTGRVTNVEDFGAFVEVQSGVVGLVHVSEIDIYGPAKISDIIQTGDEVLIRIIDMDPFEERLSLSLRRVTPEEQIAWMQRQSAQEEEASVEEEATDEAESVVETETEDTAAEAIDATEETDATVESEPVAEADATVDADTTAETDVAEAAEEVVEVEEAPAEIEADADEIDVVEVEGDETGVVEVEGDEADVVEVEGDEADVVEVEGDETDVVEADASA